MKTPSTPRVIRAYTLPVSQFDHLKNFQRLLQAQADRASREDGTESVQVTNSEAMTRIIRHHEMLSMAATFANRDISSFATGLYLGDLKAVEVQP